MLESKIQGELKETERKESLKQVYSHVIKHLIDNPGHLLTLRNAFHTQVDDRVRALSDKSLQSFESLCIDSESSMSL